MVMDDRSLSRIHQLEVGILKEIESLEMSYE